MFSSKSTPKTNPNEEQKPPKPKKRHIIRKIFKYLGIFLCLILILACAGAYWLCQTESGQHYLVSTLNKVLAPAKGGEGLNIQITKLSGSLPFNFLLGLQASDSKGLFLNAPENRFTLNWTELPSSLHISALKLVNIDLSRLPDLPKSEESPEKNSKPFGIQELQALLQELSSFLSQKHWWLPNIKLDGIEIQNAVLPANLLPSKEKDKELRMAADMDFQAAFITNQASAKLNASLRDSQNGYVEIPSFSFRKLSLNTALNFSAESSLLENILHLRLNVDESNLDLEDFPKDLLGENLELNIKLSAKADTALERQGLTVNLEGPVLAAGILNLNTQAHWQSGQGWKAGAIDGPLDFTLDAAASPLAKAWLDSHPTSPLAMLRDPLKLSVKADGTLPKTNLLVNVAAPRIVASGHNLTNIDLSVTAKDLALPLPPQTFDLLQQEQHCDLNFKASVDNEPVSLFTQAYFQALELSTQSGEKSQAWLASLRNLDLKALGLNASGEVQAFIPPEKMPALDGNLKVEIDKWEAVQKFLPDQLLSGHVKMDLHLDNAEAHSHSISSPSSPQNVLLNLDIPTFSMSPIRGGQPIEIQNLKSRIDLSDLFATLKIDAALQAARIQAEGMKLKADIKASGAIKGPLEAEIITSGDVKTNIAASWSPGTANLKKCDLAVTLPASLSPSGKAVSLSIRSENPALIHYGDGGISVEKLNLKINPSGRLMADGSLSPDKLNFKIKLDAVDFKPWQILSPQIPLGSANLDLNLAGSPHTPKGDFNLTLRDVSLPGAPLPPFGLNLKGGIENASSGSALGLRLTLDPKSLKALGCDKSQIDARIPLLFAKDGIPNINMTGPLAATVHWDGALGPIWNLLPMPDKRLNGRVLINIKAGGTLKTPKIQGGVTLNKARFEDLLLGVLITDINLKADLSDRGPLKKTPGALDSLPGSIKLDLSAGDGRGGTVTVNGGAALDGKDLNIKAKINHLRPLRRRDIHIDLSADASVTGSALAPIINGQLIVNQGEVLLNNLEMMGSVTTLPISQGKVKKSPAVEKKAETQSAGAGSINFKIDMLPRFTVEGRGLTSIWTAHLLISGSPFNPSITGNISSVRGNFDFLGKNFALTKGIVFFGGGSLSNPLIDMELTNETPDLTAHIIVSGPVNKIKIQLTSSPELPRDEILSRVLFGRSVGDLSRFEALQLAAGVAQLAGFGSGGGLLSSAKKALGVDVLRLGTSASDAAGEPGDMTAGGTTIEMGKYINDMIYMGVQQGMKADSTAFIIQLELTPRTNLEIRTEQNNTWGGIKWKYNY